MSYRCERRRLRGFLRRLLVVTTVGVLLAAGITVLLDGVETGFGATRAAEAFLDDIHDGRYSAAYDHLCQDGVNPESRSSFVSRWTRAHDSRHGITSFYLRAIVGKEALSFNTIVGTTRFAEGASKDVEWGGMTGKAPTCIKGPI